MRRSVVAAVLLAGLALVPGCGERASGAEELGSKAKEFVELLARGDFAKAAEGFDGTMKKVLPPSKLEEAWKSIALQSGSFKGQRGVRAAKEAGREARYVTCEFEKAAIDVKLVFNGAGEISGLWFVPSKARAGYKPPAYANVFRRGRGDSWDRGMGFARDAFDAGGFWAVCGACAGARVGAARP